MSSAPVFLHAGRCRTTPQSNVPAMDTIPGNRVLLFARARIGPEKQQTFTARGICALVSLKTTMFCPSFFRGLVFTATTCLGVFSFSLILVLILLQKPFFEGFFHWCQTLQRALGVLRRLLNKGSLCTSQLLTPSVSISEVR